MAFDTTTQDALFRCISAGHAWFETRGITAEIGYDFDVFHAHLDRLDYDRVETRNITFMPKLNNLGPTNAHFVVLREIGRDAPIGILAARLLPPAPNLAELFRSKRYLSDRDDTVSDQERHELPEFEILDPSIAAIAGRITCSGNAFIVPRFRSSQLPPHMRGFSTKLVLLHRALTLHRYEPDWHVTMMRQVQRDRNMDVATYRLPRATTPWLKIKGFVLFGSAERPADLLPALSFDPVAVQTVGSASNPPT